MQPNRQPNRLKITTTGALKTRRVRLRVFKQLKVTVAKKVLHTHDKRVCVKRI